VPGRAGPGARRDRLAAVLLPVGGHLLGRRDLPGGGVFETAPKRRDHLVNLARIHGLGRAVVLLIW
jgi:hypothetical protein